MNHFTSLYSGFKLENEATIPSLVHPLEISAVMRRSKTEARILSFFISTKIGAIQARSISHIHHDLNKIHSYVEVDETKKH